MQKEGNGKKEVVDGKQVLDIGKVIIFIYYFINTLINYFFKFLAHLYIYSLIFKFICKFV
jgi:hypothetical protein